MLLKNYKNIVIKIGSSTIVNETNYKIKDKWLHSICKDIFELTKMNKKISIVSSGAIALGKKIIAQKKPIKRLEDKQAAAAVGQIELANCWQQALRKNKINSAQILLTLDDSEVRRRYLNVRKTISSLHKNNFIPIVILLIAKVLFCIMEKLSLVGILDFFREIIFFSVGV